MVAITITMKGEGTMELPGYVIGELRRRFNEIAYKTDARTVEETSRLRDEFIRDIVDEVVRCME